MDKPSIGQRLKDACNTAVLCKINTLARDLTGVGLLAVWARGDACGQIPVCDSERELPRFCRLLHELPQGLHRCVTCHSLLALAARNRGEIVQGRCYGGAFVVAAPAELKDSEPPIDVVVISSCAFALSDRQHGWRTTRRIARDLGLDLTELRRAYDELPELHGAKIKVIGEVVDAAAAALTEALRSRMPAAAGAPGREGAGGVEARLRTALQASHDPAFRRSAGTTQTTVVDVVQAVVRSNPQLPVTVSDIGRAAHMSPNHFSLVFRKQTGSTFTAFLADTRMARAKDRLSDLTLSIGQVARQAGFSDPNYFAKVFHRSTGVSPREWRRRRRRPAAKIVNGSARAAGGG